MCFQFFVLFCDFLHFVHPKLEIPCNLAVVTFRMDSSLTSRVSQICAFPSAHNPCPLQKLEPFSQFCFLISDHIARTLDGVPLESDTALLPDLDTLLILFMLGFLSFVMQLFPILKDPFSLFLFQFKISMY